MVSPGEADPIDYGVGKDQAVSLLGVRATGEAYGVTHSVNVTRLRRIAGGVSIQARLHEEPIGLAISAEQDDTSSFDTQPVARQIERSQAEYIRGNTRSYANLLLGIDLPDEELKKFHTFVTSQIFPMMRSLRTKQDKPLRAIERRIEEIQLYIEGRSPAELQQHFAAPSRAVIGVQRINSVKRLHEDFPAAVLRKQFGSAATVKQVRIKSQPVSKPILPVGPVPNATKQPVAKQVSPILDRLEAAKDTSLNMYTGDSTRQYFNEIAKIPLLEAAEEVELAKIIEAGVYAQYRLDQLGTKMDLVTKRELQQIVREGERANKHFIEANLRLVVNTAKKYAGLGMDLHDLIAEGNFGLMHAIELFDYKQGYKFSTYALWWIRQAITRSMADQGRTVRVPVHMVERINKLRRITREYIEVNGREATLDELAELMEVESTDVQQLQQHARDIVSLDTPIGDDGGSVLGDLIADNNGDDAHRALVFASRREAIMGVLGTLAARERDVVMMRFGLVDGTEYTTDQIAQKYNLNRQAINNILSKTKAKLSHPARGTTLYDFIDL